MIATAALIALAALAGEGTFTPATDVTAVAEPTRAAEVARLRAGQAYPLLKRGGPDRAWCKLQLDGAVGWVPCSAAAPPPRAAPAFDYYVLSLSWSPTFCGDKGDRAPEQCAPGKGLGLVVHGLWPQLERGYPHSCGRAPLDRALVRSMTDLMPSERLVEHEWAKHGTCSGLDARAYFDTVRAARAKLRLPPELARADQARDARLADVEGWLIAANPGLAPDMIAVVCDDRLSELRICLDKSLAFRACGADVRDRCKGRTRLPPAR